MRDLMNLSPDEIDRVIADEQVRNDRKRVADGGILDENVRLLLQCAVDRGGVLTSTPIALSGVAETCVRVGLMTRDTGPEDARVFMVSYAITPTGIGCLQKANISLGLRATRYVHRLIEVGGQSIVFGYPFKQPIDFPFVMFQGCIYHDERPLPRIRTNSFRPLYADRPFPYFSLVAAILVAVAALIVWGMNR